MLFLFKLRVMKQLTNCTIVNCQLDNINYVGKIDDIGGGEDNCFRF